MSIVKLSCCLAIVCAGACGCSGARMSDPASEVEIENLLRQSLSEEFTPGREIIVASVEIPPNSTLERHWHPGEEFHYYMEGEVEIVVDGRPSIKGTPGTVGHVPYRAMHTAITGDKGARIVVFRVHSEGEPVRYLEGGGSGTR